MKSIILLLCLMIFAPFTINAQWYRHKSENKIARITPAQRVDEWVSEQAHHRYDMSDDHGDLLRKYIMLDGLKAVPRLIEIIDEYDPTRFREGKGKRGERFDASFLMLGYIDDYGIRLRSSEEGRRALDALDRVIERMRAAGYGQLDKDDWERHGRFDLTVIQFDHAKGINRKDESIRNTLRFVYKIILSDDELLEFSNFMTAHLPNYPSWSNGKLTKDNTQLNRNGDPVRIIVLEKPERYYEAYMEFKKTKRW